MVKMRVTIQRNTLQDIQDCIISLNLGVSMFSNVNAKKPIIPCMAAFVSSSPSETKSCVPPADRLKLPYKIFSVYPNNFIRIYEKLEETHTISKTLFSNGIVVEEMSVQGEELETYFENLIGAKSHNKLRAG